MSCRDCKHWGAVPYPYRDGRLAEEWREQLEGNEPHQICGAIKLLDPHEHAGPTAAAYVRDGSGYVGELWTSPTFVCSLFEPR